MKGDGRRSEIERSPIAIVVSVRVNVLIISMLWDARSLNKPPESASAIKTLEYWGKRTHLLIELSVRNLSHHRGIAILRSIFLYSSLSPGFRHK